MLTAAFLFPAQSTNQNLGEALRGAAPPVQQPPVDSLGSGSLTQTGPMGTAQVFWSTPEPGKLKGTIIIPAPKEKAAEDREAVGAETD